jgi:hypothetical protein
MELSHINPATLHISQGCGIVRLWGCELVFCGVWAPGFVI